MMDKLEMYFHPSVVTNNVISQYFRFSLNSFNFDVFLNAVWTRLQCLLKQILTNFST